jgi:hypothetical protein
MPSIKPQEFASPSQKIIKQGLLNPDKVRIITFSVIVLCILISVTACIMAVWDFTKKDVLWRTVSTCLIIVAGMVSFGIVNTAYGKSSEQ